MFVLKTCRTVDPSPPGGLQLKCLPVRIPEKFRIVWGMAFTDVYFSCFFTAFIQTAEYVY